MDHQAALSLKKLHRQERWARIFYERAYERGDVRRGLRAANLMNAVEAKFMGHLGREISPYRD